jgi:hypothetical protein
MGFLSFSQKHGHSIFAGSALAEARLPAQIHETDLAEGCHCLLTTPRNWKVET